MTPNPLRLFDVLVEEYENQNPAAGLQPPDKKTWRADLAPRFASITDKEEREQRLDEELVGRFYQWLHDNKVRRSALCFSGGGIRSATFGLGVLQGFARFGLLKEFDFLSTVSGGGYLGSWLSAWIYRKGLAAVAEDLKSEPQTPLEPEPEAVRHLRAYSNYMSPQLGLLSADTWTLVGIYLRNLILNWFVLIPLIAAVLMIPRICVAVVRSAPPYWLAQLSLWLGVASGIFAIAYMMANQPSLLSLQRKNSPFDWKHAKDRARSSQGWFLLYCWLPMLALSVLVTTYWAWLHEDAIRIRFWLAGTWSFNTFLAFFFFTLLLTAGGYLLSRLWARPASFEPALLGIILLSDLIGTCVLWLVAGKAFPMVASGMEVGNAGGAAVHFTVLYVCLAAPLFLLTFLFAATMFVGFSSRLLDDADREWFARAGAWMLIAVALWSVVSALVLFGPVVLNYLGTKLMASVGGLSGLVTLILGRSSKTDARAEPNPRNNPGAAVAKIATAAAAPLFAICVVIFLALGSSWLIKKITEVFLPVDWTHTPYLTYDLHWGLMNIAYYSPLRILLPLTALFVAVGVFMGFVVHVNKFSLHSAYRDRLIRAYLGASRRDSERKPNPFTGFDENDNIQMHELRTDLLQPQSISDLEKFRGRLLDKKDEAANYVFKNLAAETRQLLENNGPAEVLLPALIDDLNKFIQNKSLQGAAEFQLQVKALFPSLSSDQAALHSTWMNRSLLQMAFPDELRRAEPCKPFHVVNMALNLVSGSNLAWQQRKAESFTASPLHCGSFRLGYRDSALYGANKNVGSAISLGTAAAISGAAASPNMGYHSSPLVAFLLTLFNVRLGWWLGNPGQPGEETYMKVGPSFAPASLLAEAFGLTDDKNPYVYLSDGGHFENLGIYEMVLRRCHHIVVIDGSQDEYFTFEDLANAVAKIRVDLGVPVKFERIRMLPRKKSSKTYFGEQNAKRSEYCAIARVCYSSADNRIARTPVDDADGFLIYIKASLNGSEPVDVFNYAKSHPDFPHQSTADQFFSESQFESYRELGSHIIDSICGGVGAISGVDSFFTKLAKQLGESPSATT